MREELRGLDDHIEGRYHPDNPANMIEYPHCDDAMIRLTDIVCWKCKNFVNGYCPDCDSEGRGRCVCKK